MQQLNTKERYQLLHKNILPVVDRIYEQFKNKYQNYILDCPYHTNRTNEARSLNVLYLTLDMEQFKDNLSNSKLAIAIDFDMMYGYIHIWVYDYENKPGNDIHIGRDYFETKIYLALPYYSYNKIVSTINSSVELIDRMISILMNKYNGANT